MYQTSATSKIRMDPYRRNGKNDWEERKNGNAQKFDGLEQPDKEDLLRTFCKISHFVKYVSFCKMKISV